MVELVTALLSDKPKLAKLLDQYLQELSEYREIKVGATCAADYFYMDLYWMEPGRHPFLIFSNDQLAGFILVWVQSNTESPLARVAEFFIIPEQRRKGVGRKAASKVFSLFPGHWELQVHSRNQAALAFWDGCIRQNAKSEPEVSQITEADGRRIQYNFEV